MTSFLDSGSVSGIALLDFSDMVVKRRYRRFVRIRLLFLQVLQRHFSLVYLDTKDFINLPNRVPQIICFRRCMPGTLELLPRQSL